MGIYRRLRQLLPAPAPRVVRVAAANGAAKGTVVLSYLTDSFDGDPSQHYHSNRWECRCIAQTFAAAAFDVVVINHDDLRYRPPASCRAVIDLHSNLERLASLAPADARKILHITGAHWDFQNRAEIGRLKALQARRGVSLTPRRQVPASRGIEVADIATTTGNDFTIGTFAAAGKPIHRAPVSSTYVQDWPTEKDFDACRTRFLWFGSHGLVHKGLDLVLEAFAQTPELHLTIAGPVSAEPDFARAYRRELALPNVRVVDWIDTRSAQFRDLLQATGAIVYPSCSEGGGGSVITCLHGGLVPVVTREASVDVGDFGFLLREAGVAAIADAARAAAALPVREFTARSRAAWELARLQHTREAFAAHYRRFVRDALHFPIAS